MSGAVGRLAVILGLNSASFEAGLTASAKQANFAAKDIERSFDSLGGKFGSLLGPLDMLGGKFGNILGTVGQTVGSVIRTVGPLGESIGALGMAAAGAGLGFVALGAAALGLATSGAEAVETFEHLAEKTGISIENLVAWDAVAKAGGTTLEVFELGMKRLEVAMSGITPAGKAARAVLLELGITAKDPQEALLEIADAFSKMPDGANKAALAVAIFGRSGTDMIPVLDQGRAGIEKWQRETENLGKIMAAGVGSAQKYRDMTVELGISWDTAKVSVVGFLGTLVDLGKWFDGHIAQAAAFSEALQGRTETLPIGTSQKAIDKQREELEREAGTASTANAQKALDLAKARGPVEAQILSLKRDIVEAEKQTDQAGMLHTAELLRQVTALEPVAALEKSAREEAERRLAAYQAIMKLIPTTATPVGAGGPLGPRNRGKEPETFWTQGGNQPIEALGMPTIGESSQILQMQKLLSEAPNVGGGPSAMPDALEGVAPKVNDLKETMQSFTDMFFGGLTQDISRLQEMGAVFEDLRAKGAISEGQFTDVMNRLDAAIIHANYDLAVQTGTVTFGQAFQNMFLTLEEQSRNFAAALANDVGRAITDLNRGLAQLIVTGKGLDAKKILQGFGESVIQSGLQKMEGSVFGALGLGGGKHDGSSASNALYTQDVSLSGTVGGAGGGTVFDSFFSNLTKGFSGMFGALKNVFSTIFSNVGGGLSGLVTAFSFGGGLAGGGATMPGTSYLVGENGPEIFTPGAAGVVSSSAATRPQVIYNIDARGADAGVESRVRSAMRDTEDRAVVRAVASVHELQKRRVG